MELPSFNKYWQDCLKIIINLQNYAVKLIKSFPIDKKISKKWRNPTETQDNQKRMKQYLQKIPNHLLKLQVTDRYCWKPKKFQQNWVKPDNYIEKIFIYSVGVRVFPIKPFIFPFFLDEVGLKQTHFIFFTKKCRDKVGKWYRKKTYIYMKEVRDMIKNNKTVSIEFRLTPEEKELIKDYCKKHDLTMSEFIRTACEEIFSK